MKGFHSSNKTPLKQNIPLFQRNFLGYKIYGCLDWVFSKRNYITLRSMYPYPVSGFVGTIQSNNISFHAFQLLPDCS
jgi:hypothetical protein